MSNQLNFMGKHLPVNELAERAILGSILIDPRHYEAVSEILIVDDFFVSEHKELYRTFQILSADNRGITDITIRNSLSERQVMLKESFLVSLQEEYYGNDIADHARVVKECAVKRELIDSAASIISTCYGPMDVRLDEVIEQAEKTIFKITDKRLRGGFKHVGVCMKDAFTFMASRQGVKGYTGIPSGFDRLDDMTSGFQKSELIVLAARPSMGKTAFALTLANNAMLKGHTVGFISLEMSQEQLMLRLLSNHTGICYQDLRSANLSERDYRHAFDVTGKLNKHNLFVDDTPAQTILNIRSAARKLKQQHNLNLLIIDYLQLINSVRRYENRNVEVGDISRSLKALSKELDIPIIALAQLSRALESRLNKRPLLSDLRESGAIEQDADLIMFLYRDVVYNPDTHYPDNTELIIGKHRNGPIGTVNLVYHKDYMLFESAPHTF